MADPLLIPIRAESDGIVGDGAFYADPEAIMLAMLLAAEDQDEDSLDELAGG